MRLHIVPLADELHERLGWQALEPAFYEGQDVTIMVIEPEAP